MGHKSKDSRNEIRVVHLFGLSDNEIDVAFNKMEKSGFGRCSFLDFLILAFQELILQKKFKVIASGSSCGLQHSSEFRCLCQCTSVCSLFWTYGVADWGITGRFVTISK